jgi:coenzyme F420-0:L-glutamate ligase/coenzyme F420-1:gamma-L-glutamate ligase
MVYTALPGIPLVQQGDNLAKLISEGLQRAELQLENGDVIIVAQKVVSKSEGRGVDLALVTPSPEAIRLAELSEKDPRVVEVLLQESSRVLRVRPGLIIVEHRLGFVCANAGLDHSNIEGTAGANRDHLLMLPVDPDSSAQHLRMALEQETGSKIGILIIDSHGRAWRMGTVGVAIGVAGVPALLDLRGRFDLFGNPLRITQIGLADELAAAASLLMGQAGEGRPVVHVRGIPYSLREGTLQEILRPEEEDLFR